MLACFITARSLLCVGTIGDHGRRAGGLNPKCISPLQASFIHRLHGSPLLLYRLALLSRIISSTTTAPALLSSSARTLLFCRYSAFYRLTRNTHLHARDPCVHPGSLCISEGSRLCKDACYFGRAFSVGPLLSSRQVKARPRHPAGIVRNRSQGSTADCKICGPAYSIIVGVCNHG
ncbi:hypothetical protein OE88DRAFT_254130 [Heliocybe sulcata]|uniref:Uncharacterized protein n=1 Tax=Heliocybe sulcata TaxID=5364 RepID=A0A5C3MYZ3_9AGAM|nr:hypothetical protein OE88DRAFT_254130 [Heliocybe sulcata]